MMTINKNNNNDDNQNNTDNFLSQKKLPKIEILSETESKTLEANYFCKVLIIGDPEVGKTSILNRLKFNKFSEDYSPTENQDIISLKISQNSKIIELKLYDMVNNKDFRYIVLQLYRKASFGILVYAINNRESFENLESWINDLRNVNRCPIILVGNKNDDEKGREVSYDEGKSFAEDFDIRNFFEVNCKKKGGMENFLKNTMNFVYDDLVDNDESLSYLKKNDKRGSDGGQSGLGSVKLFSTERSIMINDSDMSKSMSKKKCC